jgi:hypothetical protein
VIALALLAAFLASPSASLHVTQVTSRGSPIPIEGAYSYVRVSRPDGSQVVRRRLTRGRPLATTMPLAPGRYRLQSWQRTCDGNCGYLDAPSDRCARWFRVERGRRLNARITVTYGSGCRIAFF